MLKVLKARMFQKHRTMDYPLSIPDMPEKYLGVPAIIAESCDAKCADCVEVCPVDAISKSSDGVKLDLAKCLFCGKCADICENKAIKFTKEHRMTVNDKKNLVITEKNELIRANAVKEELLRIFKRSFKLRQVSAGGCNACESDVNVLSTVGYDLGRFGVSFVASPRHADGLLITGPVTKNMEYALKETYEALPAPKIVLAVGACAVSGGLFADSPETNSGVNDVIPVDYYIPGCPPHPLTILDGILTVINRNAKK